MTKKQDQGHSTGAASHGKPIKPVELRVMFCARPPGERDYLFSITASLLNGKLDLTVSFDGANDGPQFLPVWLLEKTQEAVQLVRMKLRPEDLTEQRG